MTVYTYGDVCAHLSVHSLDAWVMCVVIRTSMRIHVVSKSVYIQADRLYKL